MYWEARNNTSLREIRANLRIIALTGVGLTLATALCVAGAASVLGLAWPSALVLGAIVSLTDARAVARLLAGVPRRISAILRTESIFNDGTALVLYTIAVGAATSGRHVSLALFTAEFAESTAAAIAIGFAVGNLVLWVRSYATEERLAIGLSLLTPFFAFLPAEWRTPPGWSPWPPRPHHLLGRAARHPRGHPPPDLRVLGDQLRPQRRPVRPDRASPAPPHHQAPYRLMAGAGAQPVRNRRRRHHRACACSGSTPCPTCCA